MIGVDSNCSRFEQSPLTEPGTNPQVWLSAPALPCLDFSHCERLVIVAAHPDDETLGLGCVAAHLAAAGVDIEVVAISDGGAGGRVETAADRGRLQHVRRAEQRAACHRLGLPDPVHFGMPDGGLDDHEAEIAEKLVPILERSRRPALCAAVWRGDGHPDHEAVGRAAAVAACAAGSTLWEYPIWMWHWGRPDDSDIPWSRARSFVASPGLRSAKYDAVQCFQSQIVGLKDDLRPVLPPFVLDRLLAVEELVFVTEPDA